ncbi:DUF2949 domain-containing protein [Spirulina sp. CS-785/01]|uniref:DUF2949 domain-containing protein n=1 Tax=Spirulina sp. CS-785/01 TaxID=3021716 RepID=UPI00232C7FB5|nr:DUF2949 domain-containing protein [Spirulina sp. CS-785/01]MDB9314361.1 DUF2949 domain-containing protein [Spirulina sp. CS-785/01]
MSAQLSTRLLHFLQEELALPSESIQFVSRHHQLTVDSFPMILWQYGLVNLEQLDKILEWLEINGWALATRPANKA